MTLVFDDVHELSPIRQKTASTTNSTSTRFLDLSTQSHHATTGTRLTDVNTVFYEHLNLTPSSLRPNPASWKPSIRLSDGTTDAVFDVDFDAEPKYAIAAREDTVSIERVAVGAGASVLTISAALLFANEISSRVYIDGTVGLVGVLAGFCFIVMAKLPR